ncbi:MAG: hypothetical protein ACYCX4_02660 [Bacillota bacterium]
MAKKKQNRESRGQRLEVIDTKYNFKTIVISHDAMDLARKYGLVEENKEKRQPAEVIPLPTKSEGDGK